MQFVGLIAAAILQPWGGPQDFPKLYVQSIDACFAAEKAYRAGKYRQSEIILNKFWIEHPPGTREWEKELGEEHRLTLSRGLMFGNPGCYYALRMLTECVEWRLSPAKKVKPYPIRLTVVEVRESTGIQPSSMEELRANTGHQAHHTLDPLLARNNGAIDQSLYLFEEYVSAMTDGRLRVKHQVVPLDLNVTVRVTANEKLLFAGLADNAMPDIWRSIDQETRRKTDWWFILYPSHVPNQYPDFTHTEFITGGMGTGPDGRSPAFMIDDLWLVRVPPHLGYGSLNEAERRAWMPQWFQHEFFHHLYRTYFELRLEASGHQWFDRKAWPSDFGGFLEADYYAESLHKRLKSIEPPMHEALQYRLPSPDTLSKLTPAMMHGKYIRDPVANDWHVGVIEGDAETLHWSNDAGRTWRLTPDFSHGVLRTGPDNPYHDTEPGEVFRVVLRRDANGNYLPEVVGFNFNGEFYRRVS